MDTVPANLGNQRGFREAICFWEPRRMWYNAVLLAVVVLWVVFTWPHFRPALNWADFGRMCILALLANICYCAAYVAEVFIQTVVAGTCRRRVRYAIWIVGMLIAIVFTNYWIADEIYPDISQGISAVVPSVNSSSVGGGSNMNFPAPLAAVGFLAGFFGIFVAALAAMVFWFARKPKFARGAGLALGIGTVIYFGLLIGFSEASHDTALALGQEKYFCEIDCHLAYAVVGVKTQPLGEEKDYIVTLRTRFDEKTISPQRPKDAPLIPSPREVCLIDSQGRTYQLTSTSGTSLMTPLRPGESYTTELDFRVPRNTEGMRLLVNTIPGWPDRVVIGDENSWLHKKTYLAL